MGLLDSLRVRNTLAGLFQPDSVQLNPNQMTPDQVSTISSGSPTDPNQGLMSGDYQLENIRKLMTPSNDAQTRLNSQLDTQPDREQYKPSMLRKIVSGMIMEQNPAVGERFRNRRYDEAMSDWNAKLAPLKELSGSERAENTNNRLTANAMLRDQNADQERERKTAKDAADNQLKRDKLDEQYYFAGIKEQALYQPNVVQFMDDNGKLYTLDKKSGDIKPTVNPLTGEQMNGSKLPQAEQMKLKQNNDLALVAARGSQARQTVAAQGEKEVDVSGKTKQDKIDVKAATPGKNTAPVEGSGSGKKPSQQGTVRMIAPDGKTHGTLPASKLKEYLAKGYKVE